MMVTSSPVNPFPSRLRSKPQVAPNSLEGKATCRAPPQRMVATSLVSCHPLPPQLAWPRGLRACFWTSQAGCHLRALACPPASFSLSLGQPPPSAGCPPHRHQCFLCHSFPCPCLSPTARVTAGYCRSHVIPSSGTSYAHLPEWASRAHGFHPLML